MSGRILEDVLARVANTNKRWDAEWRQLSEGQRLAILVEEVGEVARALNNEWNDDQRDLRHELVDVAAVAVNWLTRIDQDAAQMSLLA